MRIRTFQITGRDFVVVVDRATRAEYDSLTPECMKNMEVSSGAKTVWVFGEPFGDVQLEGDEDPDLDVYRTAWPE